LTGTVSRGINHPALKSIRIPKINSSEQKVITSKVRGVLQNHVLALSRIEQAKKLFEEALNINHQKINEEKTYSVNSADLTDIFTPKFYYPKYLNTLKALKKKFKTIELGEIADIKRGDEVGSENYRKYIDRKDPDIPFIRTSDLVNYEIDNYPDYYIDEEIYKELKQDLRAGDIIYTKDGKIGLSAILTAEDKCILASGLARIRIKKELDPYYAFLVLSTNISYYQAMQRVVIAATLPHLQQERLGEIEIPIINDQTQNKISQLVAEAFKLKAEKKKLFREALTTVEELLK
jgi:type I restriction enzyme S subunit